VDRAEWNGQTVGPPNGLAFSFGKFSSLKSGFQPTKVSGKDSSRQVICGFFSPLLRGYGLDDIFWGFHRFVDEVHIPKQGRLSKWSTFLFFFFFFFSVNEKTKKLFIMGI